MKTTEAIETVNKAISATDLFDIEDAAKAKKQYLNIVKALHPDTVDKAYTDQAAQALIKLNKFWESYNSGDTREITTPKATYSVGPFFRSGSVANLYTSKYDTSPVLVKIPRSPKDNDLIQAEIQALRRLTDEDRGNFGAFHPTYIDHIRIKDTTTKVERQISIFNKVDNTYNLAEVKATHGDLDPKHAAWMWRRLLYVLGFVHSCDIVHGAIVPENVIIQPDAHGVILVGWPYASIDEANIKAIPKGYKDWYPSEVFDSDAIPSAATDIYMVSKLMAWLMGNKIPQMMKAFVAGCTTENQFKRPGDAWALAEEFDELLLKLFGPRKFVPFSMN